jgi:conjugative relaxase-like TrwC/TraI family protein
VLNIGKLAAGRASYYVSLAAGVEDYYTGHGEPAGRWFGHGAELLGLDGVVTADDLSAVLAGRAPGSDDRLTRARMAGFDLTFRAPKSVSLMFGLGEFGSVAGEVVGAHEAAVQAAVGYLERVACVTRRRVDGEITRFVGDGFVAAGFGHQTSRAGDPTLHTHVLVANMTRTGDGRWGALDGFQIFDQAKTAGYLYQAHLRGELTRRLGVEWGPVVNGCADVAGVPDGVIVEFSQRRAEILDRMEQRGEWSAKAAQAAALDTRRAKDYQVDGTELRAGWAERADRVGFGPDRIAELVERAVRRDPVGLGVGDTFGELAGPDGLTKHNSTFGRPDVVRAIASRLPEGADVATVEGLADTFLFTSKPVRVDSMHGRLWTTQELLDTEHRVIAGVVARRHDRAGIAGRAEVTAAIAARSTISDEQGDMVADLCLSGHGVDVVVGAAGTGKTFALDTARHAWQRSGFTVYGAALSARAAAELEAGSGIGSVTIARLLAQLESGRLRFDDRTVVVIDEAAMVGTRTLDRLHHATGSVGAKLVLVGDPAQLAEIEAGGTFRALTEQLDVVRLVENRRQVEPWERRALDDLRAGRIADAVAAYDNRQRIIVVADPDTLRDRVIDDWFASHQTGENALMIAAHRAEVRDLNRRARRLLDDAGRLGSTRLVVGPLEFAEGDRIMAVGRNHYDLDIFNGDLGTITHIDPDTRHITFQSDRVGTVRTMPAARIEDGCLDHGYARTNHKAQGVTVDRTFTLGDDGDLDRQAAYAALSRGRKDNRLYVLEPDDDPTNHNSPDQVVRDHVERELSRDRSQRLASDQITKRSLSDELLTHLPALAAGTERVPEPHFGRDDDLGIELW